MTSMELTRYFIELSYDGSAYHGWQRQPNAISVQQVLEEALSRLARNSISLLGAGRTDTGVHALQMYAHFDVSQKIANTKELIFHLNGFLKDDISIKGIRQVQPMQMLVLTLLQDTMNIIFLRRKTPSIHNFIIT